MNLSIHYYILSLSAKTSRLYEGFRDELIDIQNTGFPFHMASNGPTATGIPSEDLQLRDFFYKTDVHFAHYYEQDPLRLMVVGQSSYLKIYQALTAHSDVIIGTVEGDFSTTSAHDLGKIVWPIVKLAMAGSMKDALLEIAEAEALNNVISGIDAVWNSTEANPGATLFVEDDYHMKGAVPETDHPHVFVNSVNLWELFNDAVDIIIEKVMVTGGAVIFMDSGSLTKQQRIALLLRD